MQADEPCTQFLGFDLPVRSRTQIVPLDIVPHSAPLPTTLTAPLPFALNVVQLDPQDLASMTAPDAGARGREGGKDGGEEGNLSHATCIGMAGGRSSKPSVNPKRRPTWRSPSIATRGSPSP